LDVGVGGPTFARSHGDQLRWLRFTAFTQQGTEGFATLGKPPARGTRGSSGAQRDHIWIHDEWRAGFPVECALLEECSDYDLDYLEVEWMSKFPNLINERDYCYCGCKPPVIPEIKDYMRDHIANCDGFRGIVWWRQFDSYSVFLPGGKWMIGEELPYWGGNIFFSDMARALNARDQVRGPNWLPDIEQEPDLYVEPLRCLRK
jgi:hypothetical protein